MLVTTDFSLEGVHFRREWHSPESVGHRCLTRGLSDIAAMGGSPLAAFLSLAVPSKLPQMWIDQFLKGFLKLADKFGVPLAGGDTAESREGVLADIVVIGSVPKGTAVLRFGARAGDRIYVSGELGGSAATLDLLFSGKRKKITSSLYPRYLFPTPRIHVGKILRQKRIATAMIDISDGLSTDLTHICEESRVGAELWSGAVPRATVSGRQVDLQFALHGGDDYELLFTAKPNVSVPARIDGLPITCIGEITRRKNLVLVRADKTRSSLKSGGWQHFQRSCPDK
jgi:thiamine-monophosphate kinase